MSADLGELLERCKASDEQAWRTLVERFSRYVYAITRAHRLDDAMAEDVFQEVFLRTWRNLDDLNGPDALRPWIGQVTRRLCIDAIRKSSRERPEEDAGLTVADPRPELSQLELALDVHDALARLNPDCQAVLDAFFCRDRSYVEISEEFGVPTGTIASRISRCLDRLRDRLSVTVA